VSCCSAGGGGGGDGFASSASCVSGSVGFPAMVNALALSTSFSSSGLTLRRFFFRSLASSFCSFNFASRAFRFFRTASAWLFPSLVSRGSRSRVGLEGEGGGGYACAARFASSWALLAVSRPASSDTASGASPSESESNSESAAVELVGVFSSSGGGDKFLVLSMCFSVASASLCFLGLGGVVAGVVRSSRWGCGSSEAGWELLGLSRTGTRGIESLLRRALVTGAIGELLKFVGPCWSGGERRGREESDEK